MKYLYLFLKIYFNKAKASEIFEFSRWADSILYSLIEKEVE